MLEARVAALADGEVAARHEHHRSRRTHAYDARVLFPAADAGLRLGSCGRGRISGRARARRGQPVARLPSQVVRARHKIRIRVDLLLALRLFVRPERLEQLLARKIVVTYKEKTRFSSSLDSPFNNDTDNDK